MLPVGALRTVGLQFVTRRVLEADCCLTSQLDFQVCTHSVHYTVHNAIPTDSTPHLACNTVPCKPASFKHTTVAASTHI